jgi:hypothetical protein
MVSDDRTIVLVLVEVYSHYGAKANMEAGRPQDARACSAGN